MDERGPPTRMLPASERTRDSARAAAGRRPRDFFHRLAALAVSDARVALRVKSKAWVEPRSLLEDRRAAMRFRFLWQCIKMDHRDAKHRDKVDKIWSGLDERDQQAFLQAHDQGPPTPDFFINCVMPTKLMKTIDEASKPEDVASLIKSVARSSPTKPVDTSPDAAMIADLEQAREASRAACLAEIAAHLDMFAQRQPFASYEEWIAELHPESARKGDKAWGAPVIDARYYLDESDHRVLWNTKVEALHCVVSRDPKLAVSFQDDSGYPQPGPRDNLPTTTLLLPQRSAMAQRH